MLFFVLTFIVFGLLVIHYVFLKPKHNLWKTRGVIGPTPSMLVGNLGESVVMKNSLGQLYTNIYYQFKDLPYVGIYKLYWPAIILRDADIIKDVLIKEFGKFHDNAIDVDENVSSIFAKNPFVLNGERWKWVRSKLTPCFTSGKMKSMVPLVHESGEKMVNYIKRETQLNSYLEFDAKELAAKFTTENVASCAFGTEGKCFDNPNAEFREIGRKMFQPSTLQGIQATVVFIWPGLAKFLGLKFIPPQSEERFKQIIRRIADYRIKNNVVRNDFLDVMRDLKSRKDGFTFTDDDVAIQCAGFFIDGYETSSITLSFILFDLADNPLVQTRLKEEIDNTLLKYDGRITYEAIQEMTFLDCVYNGQRFAAIQIKIGLVHLIKSFEIKVGTKTKTPVEIDPRSFLTATKDPVWLRFIPRN